MEDDPKDLDNLRKQGIFRTKDSVNREVQKWGDRNGISRSVIMTIDVVVLRQGITHDPFKEGG